MKGAYSSVRPVNTADRAPSLLERLRSDDLQLHREVRDPVAERVESIKANLNRVLNGRVGGAASAPAFGLDDLNDSAMGSRDLMAAIANDIRRVLTAYEPRIEDVSVKFDRQLNEGVELHFTIQARTRIQHEGHELAIEFVMKEGRHIAVI
ncbi:MAG: type VI secretion system baseplate subunit TssE [Rhizobiaceae bacterium]|nr:type VI secretion system baseplate subunit TssE [Rhizobiaceae bacterium]